MSQFDKQSIDKTFSNGTTGSKNAHKPSVSEDNTPKITGTKRTGNWDTENDPRNIESESTTLNENELIDERRRKRQAILAKYATEKPDEAPMPMPISSTSTESTTIAPSIKEESIVGNKKLDTESTTVNAQYKEKSNLYDSDSEDDMFADSDSDSDSVVNTKKPNKAISVGKGRKLDESMHENWDDEEGYYRTIVGELIKDRYLINATLGRGMFAEVVRATDNVTGETLAIKIIRNNDMMRKAAAKEISILQKLQDNDPTDNMHIVRLKYTFDHKNHLCLVFVNLSFNLREVIKKFGKDCGLNIMAVKSYTHQILIGLLALERSGVIHADLKPDNILVNENHSILKICDLGSASDISECEITPYLASRFYRAPELILGLKYGHGIDMWSVGCTLYELYTGNIMFPGKSNNNMLKVIMEVRGKFNHKLLKKGKFGSQHFDSQFNFLSQEIDSLTGTPIVKTISITQPTRDLKSLLKGMEQSGPNLILLNDFIDLLDKMLNINPEKRITPEEALNHPFVKGSI